MTKIMKMAVEKREFDDGVAFQLCNQIAGEMITKLAHFSCKHYLVCAFRGSKIQLITFQLSAKIVSREQFGTILM